MMCPSFRRHNYAPLISRSDFSQPPPSGTHPRTGSHRKASAQAPPPTPPRSPRPGQTVDEEADWEEEQRTAGRRKARRTGPLTRWPAVLRPSPPCGEFPGEARFGAAHSRALRRSYARRSPVKKTGKQKICFSRFTTRFFFKLLYFGVIFSLDRQVTWNALFSKYKGNVRIYREDRGLWGHNPGGDSS